MIGPKSPKGPKQIPAANRAAVATRSGGMCEACGEYPATDVHHRKYRSRGGSHAVSNLIAVCGRGNTSGCHGIAHTGFGERLGWSTPSWQREEMRPMLRANVGWVIYYDEPIDGAWWREITESTAQMLMNGSSGDGEPISSASQDTRGPDDGHEV